MSTGKRTPPAAAFRLSSPRRGRPTVSTGSGFSSTHSSLGRLPGQPQGHRADISLIHALGNRQHQVQRVVVAGTVLPGAQLIGDVAGMLAGQRREVAAHTLVAGAMAALAGNDVALPVTDGGQLLAVGQ